jgi:hypothetical protein
MNTNIREFEGFRKLTIKLILNSYYSQKFLTSTAFADAVLSRITTRETQLGFILTNLSADFNINNLYLFANSYCLKLDQALIQEFPRLENIRNLALVRCPNITTVPAIGGVSEILIINDCPAISHIADTEYGFQLVIFNGANLNFRNFSNSFPHARTAVIGDSHLESCFEIPVKMEDLILNCPNLLKVPFHP